MTLSSSYGSEFQKTEPQTIVITGASDGIGAAAARALKSQGHNVVIIGRSESKTKAVAHELGSPWYTGDFSELASVRSLAGRLKSDFETIDVLVNNAGGIFGAQREVTEDGHEKTFQVNFVAPFLLTHLLNEVLLRSKASVISTSSVANRLFGKLNLEDLESAHGRFNPRRAYGTAKLETILFTQELARRYGSQGLKAAAFHPGIIASSFASNPHSALGWIYQSPLFQRILSTPEQGAATLLWLIEHLGEPEAPSGGYFARCHRAKPARAANDPELARLLWEQTLAMVEGY